MSYVYIHGSDDDAIRVESTTHTVEYRIMIGTTKIFLPPAKAAELRAALAAALDEPRTSGGTDVSG